MADDEKVDTAPKDGEEWSSNPRTQKKERKVAGLKETNMQFVLELRSAGVPMDLGVARIEHFIVWLRQCGAFTYDEQLEEEELWQLEVRSQLKPFVDKIHTRARLAGAQERTQSGLIVSRGSGAQAKKQ